MAIFHFSVQMIKRSAGRSAVTAAAYRAGEKLNNERRAIVDDYSKKKDVAYKKIFLPDGASKKFLSREKLWNAVEAIETRKDAQLAREINIALPNELTPEQQINLIEKFVQEQFVAGGMIVDVCIHRPKQNKKKKTAGTEEEQDKPQNDHAHLEMTTREVSGEMFLQKNRDWNGREPIQKWREAWEQYANEALRAAGRDERIDHRSLESQGVDREATIHEGFVAREIERRGGVSELCQINREIKERNKKKERSRKENGSDHERGSARRSGSARKVTKRGSEKNTERNRVLLSGTKRGGVEVNHAKRMRNLRLLGSDTTERGLNERPTLENLYRITPLMIRSFGRDKTAEALAPHFQKFGIEKFELYDYMLHIEVAADRQKRGEPEPSKPNASAYQKIGSTNFGSPLTPREENLLGSILSDPALPVPEAYKGESEDWSGLTPSAKLEKMADYKFEEDY